MLPAKSSSGLSMAFPDVCKIPATPGGVPIPYPNFAKTASDQQKAVATKTPVAAKSIAGEIQALRTELNNLHNQMQVLPKGNPDLWQATLEKYLVAASALYRTLLAG